MYTEDTIQCFHIALSRLTFPDLCRSGAPVRQGSFVLVCVREAATQQGQFGKVLSLSNPLQLGGETPSQIDEDYVEIDSPIAPPLTHCQAVPFNLPTEERHRQQSTPANSSVDLCVYVLPEVTGATSLESWLEEDGAHRPDANHCGNSIHNIPGVSNEALVILKLVERGLLSLVASCTVDLAQFQGGNPTVERDIGLYRGSSETPYCLLTSKVETFASGSGIAFQIRKRFAAVDHRDTHGSGESNIEFEALDDHRSTIPVVSCSVSFQPTLGTIEERITASQADSHHPIPAAFVPKVVLNAADRWATSALHTSHRRVVYNPDEPLTDTTNSASSVVSHQPYPHGHPFHHARALPSSLQPHAPIDPPSAQSHGVIPPTVRNTPFFPLVVGSSEATFRSFPNQRLSVAVLGGPIAAYELHAPSDEQGATAATLPWWRRSHYGGGGRAPHLISGVAVPNGPRIPVASLCVTFSDVHRWMMLPSGTTHVEPGVGMITVLDVVSTIPPSAGLPSRQIRVEIRPADDPPVPHNPRLESGWAAAPWPLLSTESVPHPPPPSELYDGVFTLTLHIHNMQDWLCLMGCRPLPPIHDNEAISRSHDPRYASPHASELEKVPWSTVLLGKRQRRQEKQRSRSLEALLFSSGQRSFCTWTQRVEGRRYLAGDAAGILLEALRGSSSNNNDRILGGSREMEEPTMKQRLLRWSGFAKSLPASMREVTEDEFSRPLSTIHSPAAVRAHFEHLLMQRVPTGDQPRQPEVSTQPGAIAPSYVRPPLQVTDTYQLGDNVPPHSTPSLTSGSGSLLLKREPFSIERSRLTGSPYRHHPREAPFYVSDTTVARWDPQTAYGSLALSLPHGGGQGTTLSSFASPQVQREGVLPAATHLSSLWGETQRGTSAYWNSSPHRGLPREDPSVLLSPWRLPYATEPRPTSSPARFHHTHSSDYRMGSAAHNAAIDSIYLSQQSEQALLASMQLHRRQLDSLNGHARMLVAASPSGPSQSYGLHPLHGPYSSSTRVVSGELPPSQSPLNPSDLLYTLCLQGGATAVGGVAPYVYSCLYDSDCRLAEDAEALGNPFHRTPAFFPRPVTAGSVAVSVASRRCDEVLPEGGDGSSCQSLEDLPLHPAPAQLCLDYLRGSFLYWHLVAPEVDALVGAFCGCRAVSNYSLYHTEWTDQHRVVRLALALVVWFIWLLPVGYTSFLLACILTLLTAVFGAQSIVIGRGGVRPPQHFTDLPESLRGNPRALSHGYSAWQWLVLRPLGLLTIQKDTHLRTRSRPVLSSGRGLRSPSPPQSPSLFSRFVSGSSRAPGGSDDGYSGNASVNPYEDESSGLLSTTGEVWKNVRHVSHRYVDERIAPLRDWVSQLTPTAVEPRFQKTQQQPQAAIRRFIMEDDALSTSTARSDISISQLNSYQISPEEKITRYSLREAAALFTLHTKLFAWRQRFLVNRVPHPPLYPSTFTGGGALSHLNAEFMLSPTLRFIVLSAFLAGGRTRAAENATSQILAKTLHLRWARFFSFGQCAPLWAAIILTLVVITLVLRLYFFWLVPASHLLGPLLGVALEVGTQTLVAVYIILPESLPLRWGRALLRVFLFSDPLN